MTCAACSAGCSGRSSGADGVASANVNLMTGAATVAYDPSVTSPERAGRPRFAIPGTAPSCRCRTSRARRSLDAQDAARAEEVRELRAEVRRSSRSVGILGMHGARHATHDGRAMSRALCCCSALTLPVVGWAGRHFYTRAWAAFRHHGADMNTLIAVGTGAAFLFSVCRDAGRRLVRRPRASSRTSTSRRCVWIIALVLLGQPARGPGAGADLRRDPPADRSPPGDGARAPRRRAKPTCPLADASRRRRGPGAARRDRSRRRHRDRRREHRWTSPCSPASRCRCRSVSATAVVGATLNRNGAFRFRVERVGDDTVLSRIIRLVQQAQGVKAPIQRLADRISAVFVPVVHLDRDRDVRRLVRPRARAGLPARARVARVTVLIIACPCAMGLAVPTAVMVGHRPRRRARACWSRVARRSSGASDLDTVVLRQDRDDHRGAAGRQRSSSSPVPRRDEADLLARRGGRAARASTRWARRSSRRRAEGRACRPGVRLRGRHGRASSGRWRGAGVAVGNAAL